MSELAVAAFAAETGSHLVAEPRSARFARFARGFDEQRYLERAAAEGHPLASARSAAFPRGLASIFDPPVGIFVRGAEDDDAARAACRRDRRGALAALRTAPRWRGRSAANWPPPVSSSSAASRVESTARRIAARSRRTERRSRCSAAESTGCTRRPTPSSPGAWPSAASSCRSTHRASSPLPWRFPARNRVIAGLAAATVVVEARERSGALITADLALEEGREVFAVPGEITSALSAGTNALLRIGATALTSAADVLEAFGISPAADSEPVELSPPGRARARAASRSARGGGRARRGAGGPGGRGGDRARGARAREPRRRTGRCLSSYCSDIGVRPSRQARSSDARRPRSPSIRAGSSSSEPRPTRRSPRGRRCCPRCPGRSRSSPCSGRGSSA